MELTTSTRDATCDSAWLDEALEYARTDGQTKVVDYLEAVADDVEFEMEITARR